MIKVKGTTITMTRGDTLRQRLNFIHCGEEYVPVAGDVIRFVVKHTGSEYTDPEPLLVKEIPTDTMTLQLDPADTEALGFGTYFYDVQMSFADGTGDTYLSGSLKLTPDVD